MNKAVIYISGTTNETVNNMIVEVLERYCEKHEYEIVALLGENSQAGMSMPMKYSFIGMAEVEDIDAVVTLSSAMVGTADKEVMETIELLAHFGITVKTAKEDMDEYYDALDCEENCGCEECNVDDSEIIRELDRIFRSGMRKAVVWSLVLQRTKQGNISENRKEVNLMEIKRGDIWMVDFGPPEDDEDHLQHSIRPVVIVSNNRANEHSMVLHAVPLTSKIKKKRYMPTHVFINGFQAEGLDRHSIALCEQLCCVRYGDLMRQVGKVSTFQMLKITLGMQIQLGMVGKYNE